MCENIWDMVEVFGDWVWWLIFISGDLLLAVSHEM
jgi:hypothetical protein